MASRCSSCRAAWYAAVPGVTHTGPLNFHFVRDIGSAYLVAGGALAWLAINPGAWPAVLTAAVFLTLHAVTHLADAAGGRETLRQLLIDLPGVFRTGSDRFGFGLVGIFEGERRSSSWLEWRRIAKFERRFNYDADYTREILEAAARADAQNRCNQRACRLPSQGAFGRMARGTYRHRDGRRLRAVHPALRHHG
jgi:hypothetical protein